MILSTTRAVMLPTSKPTALPTIMGTEEASKENQYIIADVILSADDKVVSERKINFAKKVIENIGDVLNSKENTK